MGPWTNYRLPRSGDIGETERRVWIPEPNEVPVTEPGQVPVPVTAPATEPELVPA